MSIPVWPGIRDPGEIAAHNYPFIQKLWGPDGPSLREALFAHTNGNALRAALKREHVDIAPDHITRVQILLVDIEGARTKSLPALQGETFNPQEDVYVLVLPPKPRRSQDTEYQNAQAWSEASFHASSDGYGM